MLHLIRGYHSGWRSGNGRLGSPRTMECVSGELLRVRSQAHVSNVRGPGGKPTGPWCHLILSEEATVALLSEMVVLKHRKDEANIALSRSNCQSTMPEPLTARVPDTLQRVTHIYIPYCYAQKKIN